MFTLALVLSVLGLVLGPGLLRIGRGHVRMTAAIDGFTIGAVPALIASRLAPHLVAELGPRALVFLAIGYVGYLAVEARTHGKAAPIGVMIVVPLLVVHSFLDGAGLAAAFAGAATSSSSGILGCALVLHKVPEGLFVATVLVPRLGFASAMSRIGLLALATVGGALGGRELLSYAPDVVLHASVAVGLGVMLRLVVHRHGAKSASSGDRAIAAIGFVVAVAGSLLLPSPEDILGRSQPNELPVAHTLVPLFVETALGVLIGLVATALARALLAASRSRSWRSIDVGPFVFAAFCLGPRFAAMTGATMLCLTVVTHAAARARDAPPIDERPITERLADELRLTFGRRLDAIVPPYVVALLITAVVEAATPRDVLASVTGWVQVLACLAAGLLVGPTKTYGAVILAAVVLHKGGSPAAAVAFVLVGLTLTGVRDVWSARGRLAGLAMATVSAIVIVIASVSARALAPLEARQDLHGLVTHAHAAHEWLGACVVAGLLLRSLVRRGPRDWFGALVVEPDASASVTAP